MKASHSRSYLGVREIHLLSFQLVEWWEGLLRLLLSDVCYSAFVFFLYFFAVVNLVLKNKKKLKKNPNSNTLGGLFYISLLARLFASS